MKPIKQVEEIIKATTPKDNISQLYPFRSPFNSKNLPRNYEVNGMPSETIPDQSMSVKQIMQRYAQGMPLGGQREPIYEGEDFEYAGIDFNKLDLSEKYDLLQENLQRIEDMKYELQQQEFKKQQDQKRKELQQDETPLPPPSGGDADKQKEPKK